MLQRGPMRIHIFLILFFVSSCGLFNINQGSKSYPVSSESNVNPKAMLPEGHTSSELIARETYNEFKKRRQKVAYAASNATVVLKEAFPVSGTINFGTGFFISPTRIVTNRHVLQSMRNVPVVIEAPNYRQYAVKSSVILSDVDDLAILDVVNTISPYLELGDSSTVSQGDLVYVQGNPKGARDIFSSGYISSKRDENIYGIRNDRLMSITAPISPGSSGGPVMDEDGKVIGIVVSTNPDGQNLNFVIPVFCLQEFLGKIDTLSLPVSATSVVAPVK